jgi:hypothetical protein
MSNVEQKSADVAGPISPRAFRVVTPDVFDLTPYEGQWVTLLPSADMTILLASTHAAAALVAVTQNTVGALGELTESAVTGITITGGSRLDFRLPKRLGTRGEVFLGTLGAGELQFWISNNPS